MTIQQVEHDMDFVMRRAVRIVVVDFGIRISEEFRPTSATIRAFSRLISVGAPDADFVGRECECVLRQG